MRALHPYGGKTRPGPDSFSTCSRRDFEDWSKGSNLLYSGRTFDFYKAWREKQAERIHLSHEEIELDRVRDVDRVVELFRKEKINGERKQAKNYRKKYGSGSNGHYFLIKPEFKEPNKSKSKERSVEAEPIANKRANRTEKEHEDDKEAHKLYMRERRKNKCPSEKQRQASAERTVKCRERMTDERKKEEREKAAAGMQNFNATKRTLEEDPEACEKKVCHDRRQHPMTRKNAVRKELYNKETKKIDELVRYWNEEKQENLFVSPWGIHFRSGNGCHIYDHMEIVTLRDKSFLDFMRHPLGLTWKVEDFNHEHIIYISP